MENAQLRAEQAGYYLANLLGRDEPFTPQQMWRMARNGQIPSVPLGRSVLFRTVDLDSFVTAHESAASPHGVPETPPLRNCRLGEFLLDSFTLRKGGVEIVVRGQKLRLSFVEFTSERLFWERVAPCIAEAPARWSQDEWIDSVWQLIALWSNQ